MPRYANTGAFQIYPNQDKPEKFIWYFAPFCVILKKTEGLHKILDVFAKRCSPVPDSLGLGYTWTIQQIECATDIMFQKPEYLGPLYDEIIRTAIFTVKPDNIAAFLGQRIAYSCIKEIGTNYSQRILGTRIKRHMGDASVKMYDKFGRVLRIECTRNDISTFRVEREVNHRDGSSSVQNAMVLLRKQRGRPAAENCWLSCRVCFFL